MTHPSPVDDGPDPDLARAATALLRMAQEAAPRAGATRVIAIDGPSGSGKTTLAAEMQAQAGCAVVHLDRIYPGWDGLAQTPALLRDWLLAPLATGGRPGQQPEQQPGYRRYSWAKKEYAEWVPVRVADLLVVEGVGSAAAACRPYLTAIAWVEAPRDLRYSRAMARDGEVYRPYWLRWAEQEDDLFDRDPVRAHAGLLVATGDGWTHSLAG